MIVVHPEGDKRPCSDQDLGPMRWEQDRRRALTVWPRPHVPGDGGGDELGQQQTGTGSERREQGLDPRDEVASPYGHPKPRERPACRRRRQVLPPSCSLVPISPETCT